MSNTAVINREILLNEFSKNSKNETKYLFVKFIFNNNNLRLEFFTKTFDPNILFTSNITCESDIQNEYFFINFDKMNKILTKTKGDFLEVYFKKTDSEKDGNNDIEFFETTIKIDGVKALLKTDSKDYSCILPQAFKKKSFEFTTPIQNIYNSLNSISFAMSDEETRYYLNGICIDLESNNLYATNGHILGIQKLETISQDGTFTKEILAKNVVYILESIFKNKDLKNSQEIVKFEFYENFFCKITFLNNEIHCKTIDGTFPNVEQVVLQEKNIVTSYNFENVKTFLNAIDKTILLSDDKVKRIDLEFNNSENTLLLINDSDIKTEVDFIDFTTFENKENTIQTEISFNSNYLKDALGKLNDKNIFLNTHGYNTPIILQNGKISERYDDLGQILKDDDLRFILMPMRK